MRECLECRQLQKLEEFSPSERGEDGLSAYCRPCATARQRPHQAKQTAYVRQWRQGNPLWLMAHRMQQVTRRARLAGADTGLVTMDVLRQVYEVEQCTYCGEVTPTDKRTVDHVIPISRGGLHHPGNLVMACGSCNSRKRALTGDEFRERLNDGRTDANRLPGHCG